MEVSLVNADKSIRFPFIGSRGDGEPFQYILLEVGEHRAEIAIFSWLVSRVNLILQEPVDLYIPRLLSQEFDFRGNMTGTIISTRYDEELAAQVYMINFPQEILPAAVRVLSFDQFTHQLLSALPLTELVLKLLKDSVFLKHGIRVYLKHLIPYFGRIVNFSHQEYANLKEFFLRDVAKRVTNNEMELKKMYHSLEKSLYKTEQIPELIDLEVLRELMESEIHLTLFAITFNQDSSPERFSELLSNSHDNKSYMIYLNAIKELEKRLYSNYNHIVISYIKALGQD